MDFIFPLTKLLGGEAGLLNRKCGLEVNGVAYNVLGGF